MDRVDTPITTSLRTALAASDSGGRTAARRQHITAATICIVTPFVEAGAGAFAAIMLLGLHAGSREGESI